LKKELRVNYAIFLGGVASQIFTNLIVVEGFDIKVFYALLLGK